MTEETMEETMGFWDQMRQAWRDGYNGQNPNPPPRRRQVGMLLHELAPRGQVETMLAARVISARVRVREAEATVEGLYAMAKGDQLTQNIARQSGIDVRTVAYANQRADIEAAQKAVHAAERGLHAALDAFHRTRDRRKKR